MLECWRLGQGFGNQQVASMIMGCLSNRVRLGWGSWFEVLQKIPKFSATIEQPNRDLFPNIWAPDFVKLLHLVDGIYDASIPDPALGGLFWADLSGGIKGITNPWFVEKILKSPAHSVVANQNSFTIFR